MKKAKHSEEKIIGAVSVDVGAIDQAIFYPPGKQLVVGTREALPSLRRRYESANVTLSV